MAMTNREKEILDIIRSNPLISQQELADIFRISRSSVAVHITNLMKKGYIKGKGYVLEEKDYVVVIGGANVDITGFSNRELISKDSNPGKVKISLGGVGRNIAENLVRLEVDTKLLTVVGDDLYGNKILKECKSVGIDMDSTLVLNDASSSTYLSILNEKGDMNVAISHMDIFENMGIDFIKKKAHIIKNAKLGVIDTNLPENVIEYILTTYKDVEFFLDTVSTRKADKVKDLIGLCHTIKPNRIEAEVLTGIELNGPEDLRRASQILINKGVRRVFISLGEEGIYYADKQMGRLLPSPRVNVINATGAGDAFMAALVYSYLNKDDIEHCAKFAIASSVLALSHEDTINPNISIRSIKKKMEEINI